MSSHYIYVVCPTCSTSGMIYTGETELEGFNDSDWEGEVIRVQCAECSATNPIQETPPALGNAEQLREALLLFYNPAGEHQEAPHGKGTWCRHCEVTWPCRQVVARAALALA
jgi:ribosomal protein S27E